MLENIAEAEALEPTSLTEAKRRPDWLQWEQGIREELVTLDKAGTWELVNPPAGTNIVGSKWVFCAKKDAAGNCYDFLPLSRLFPYLCNSTPLLLLCPIPRRY